MNLSRLRKSPIYRIVVAQFIATFLAAASCLALSPLAALSALLAGVVCVVPGVFILFQSEKAQAARGPGLGEAMRGEVGKLLITGVLFAAVFIGVKPIDVVAFFGTFVVLQLAYVIVPLIDARRMMRR